MILEVEGVCFKYPSLDVLDSVSFDVRGGECVAILGMNGVGKSTLLKCINNILSKTSGTVCIGGEETEGMSPIELAKSVCYVPQYLVYSDVSVFDAVLLGRKPYIVWDATRADYEKVEIALRRLSMEGYALRNVRQLSGGEAQKVSIARAIVQETEVMLFDEPTSNLDLKNQMEVIDIIRREAKEREVAAIVTMHDINLALRFADKFIMMKDGKIYGVGDRSYLTPDKIKDVYGIDVHMGEINGEIVIIPARSESEIGWREGIGTQPHASTAFSDWNMGGNVTHSLTQGRQIP